MAAQPAVHPVLAQVVRSGMVESWHRGSVVVLAADGSTLYAAGSVTTPMFPRSSNKPMQGTAMLRSGLDLDGQLLALACASHSGEDFHVDGAREILRRAGLTEADLQCPPDLPLDDAARVAFLRAGGEADRIHMNCSGKHSAMLSTCVVNGWPTQSYRDRAHPLQEAIRNVIETLAGETVTTIGVDGCGAPLMALTLTGLARAFAAVNTAPDGSAERKVAEAMSGNPTWMSGTSRYEAALMTAVPGMLMKPGADGVCAFSLADGRAAAVKVDDGGQRGLPPIMAQILLDLLGAGAGSGAGVVAQAGADLAALKEMTSAPVRGGGVPVGEITSLLPTLA
jgi:L-asparaginase II